MSEEDVTEVVEGAIDKSAEAGKKLAKFIPLASNVGGGSIAMMGAFILGSMAFGKFRTAYEVSKKVKP